jgi:hypothetical protein
MKVRMIAEDIALQLLLAIERVGSWRNIAITPTTPAGVRGES